MMDPLETDPQVADKAIEEWGSYFVLVSNHNARKLHLPGKHSTREKPRPSCNQTSRNDPEEFMMKDANVFPPSHRDICKECRNRLTHRLSRG